MHDFSDRKAFHDYYENRTENITDWALEQFRVAYGDGVSKCGIFHYVYALLHHPGYRVRYAENLKKALPRIPLVGTRPAVSGVSGPADSDAAGRVPTFESFAAIGAQLMQLHFNYETAPEYALRWVETPGVPLSYRVEK